MIPPSAKITVDRHGCDIKDNNQSNDSKDRLSFSFGRWFIEKWHDQPEQAAEAESHNAEDFAVEDPNLRRDQFERLEHKEEVPFGPDACRSGGEGIGLLAQFPRENCRQGCQRADGQNPTDQIAQQEIGNKLHGFERLAFKLQRHAHAMLLHEQYMKTYEGSRNCWQHCDVKSKETREGRPSHIVATAQESHHKSADDWHDTGNLSAHLGGKVSQLIPRQQIAAESEAKRD